MTKLITVFALFVITFLSAQGQQSVNPATGGQFEQGMGKAFGLWKEGKNREASDLFERIAAAEPTYWLPNYYVALVNTTSAFGTKDKEKINSLLSKAQNALDVEIIKEQNNTELYVLQAMINTAWIVFDPITYGQKLSGPTIEIYNKALTIDANNPRAVFSKAEFEIGGARFWGQDTKPMCAQIDKAIELFATFKPETPFSPKWGLDRAIIAQKNCK